MSGGISEEKSAPAPSSAPNRAIRRENQKFDRRIRSFRLRSMESSRKYDEKIARQKKVERRVHRATTRKKEREEAEKKRLPVKYSIK